MATRHPYSDLQGNGQQQTSKCGLRSSRPACQEPRHPLPRSDGGTAVACMKWSIVVSCVSALHGVMSCLQIIKGDFSFTVQIAGSVFDAELDG